MWNRFWDSSIGETVAGILGFCIVWGLIVGAVLLVNNLAASVYFGGRQALFGDLTDFQICSALSTKPGWQTSYDSTAGECVRTYNETRQYGAYARCMAKTEEILRSAPGVYQDLITLRQTTRIALAIKVENKQLTPEDAEAQMALTISYVASEAQRRDTGQQAANAQQAAALAAIMGANLFPAELTGPRNQ